MKEEAVKPEKKKKKKEGKENIRAKMAAGGVDCQAERHGI